LNSFFAIICPFHRLTTAAVSSLTSSATSSWSATAACPPAPPPLTSSPRFLLRRYRIHVHNVEAILAAFLPYHDSSHFARLATLLSLSGKWSFLAGVASTSSPLPRAVLVRAATTDSSLLSFVVANGLTDTSTPAASSLAAAVTLDLCAACPSLPENTVTIVLASALPCVRSVTRRETLAAALMCVAAVCGRARVSAEVADTVTNTCVRRAVGGKTDSPFDSDPLLAAIVVLCFKPLESISR
jgi:U3 small nucleolar RNA-associated protein 10